MRNGGCRLMVDIDREFEDFVRKNYQLLTENQKRLCEQMGIKVSP